MGRKGSLPSVPGGLGLALGLASRRNRAPRPNWDRGQRHVPRPFVPYCTYLGTLQEVCVGVDGSVWQWLYRPTSPVAAKTSNPSIRSQASQVARNC